METAKEGSGICSEGGSASPAIDVIYREHSDWLLRLIGRRLRLQPADADDIVQNAYLRLAQQEAGTIRCPRAFLAQVTLNLFRDSKRRQAVRVAHASATKMDIAPADPNSLAEQEARLTLESIVLALPEPQRDVFVLSRFRHMTNREIADHLGVSIKTVEWRMSRALDFCISSLRD